MKADVHIQPDLQYCPVCVAGNGDTCVSTIIFVRETGVSAGWYPGEVDDTSSCTERTFRELKHACTPGSTDVYFIMIIFRTLMKGVSPVPSFAMFVAIMRA